MLVCWRSGEPDKVTNGLFEGGFSLITGAASPIGIEIVRSLEKLGPVICCVHASVLKYDFSHSESFSIELDLSAVSDLEGDLLSKLSYEHRCRVKRLVHCAGSFCAGKVRAFQPTKVDAMWSVNVASAIELCRLFLSKRFAGQLESIVLISSVSAIKGVRGYAVYGACKAAQIGFCRSLSVEIAPKARVNVICPGAIATAQDSESLGIAKLSHPLGLGLPADIGNMVAFLMDEKSKWITGSVFTVDGGWSA